MFSTHDGSRSRVLALETLIAMVLVAAGGGGAGAQEHATGERSAEEIAALQSRYRELAQPGPEHEMLARMEGTWRQEIRMWPSPGAEPTSMTGTAESRLVLGGRFLQSESRMPGSELPIGISMMGFDRRSSEYTALGLDVSGTYWVTARGPRNEESGAVVMSGEDHDPALGHTQIYDFVIRWTDDDTFIWEIVFKDEVHTRGGPPFKMVEITNHRQ